MSVKSVFIVWDSRSRRAETLANELGGSVIFQCVDTLKGIWFTPLRYLVQGWRTWRVLERERPDVVVVQSPPTLAPLIVAVWCKLRRNTRRSKLPLPLPYAVDCHTGAFHSLKWGWTLPLLRLLSQQAIVTLVTDLAALEKLYQWKARCLLLEDGLPTLSPASSTIGSEGEARVGIISVFTNDEPINEIFAAAVLLPKVTFYVTGDTKRLKGKRLARKPENVILTGYLTGGNYTGLLKNVHGLVVLTNQSYAICCAAYEAVAVAKPCLVSDWPDQRRSFTRGFIHVANTPAAIAVGIQKMLDEREKLASEVTTLHSEMIERRRPIIEEFIFLLGQTVSDDLQVPLISR